MCSLTHPTGIALNCKSTLTPLPTSPLVLLAGPLPRNSILMQTHTMSTLEVQRILGV